MFHRNVFMFLIVLIAVLSSCTGIDKKIRTDDKNVSTFKESGNFITDILKEGRQFPGETLAVVGERKITADQFKWSIGSRKDKDLDKITYNEKKKHLEEMIDKELMLIAALKKDLDKDKEIITKAEEKLRDLAINWMFKVYVTDKITVSDEEIDKRIKAGKRKKGTVEMAKERIRREIFRSRKKSLDDVWTTQCYKEAKVSYNHENLEFLAKRWLETKNRARAKNPRFPFIQKESFNLSESEKNELIATFNGGRVIVEDVIKELIDIVPPKRPMPSYNSAKKLAEYALTRPVLGKKAFDEGWHKAKEVREVLAKKVEGQLINKIQRIEVWDKLKDLKLTEKEKKAFYEKNKKRYTHKDKEGNEKITPYEKLKDSIEFEIKEEKQKEIMEAWKKSLRENITIEINENL